ncbi:Cytochrome C oxidase, cbb3-type, subunit III [Granulicella pectinivorans]|uniref:Cytochrome C oxidase, cbb3-type, subunit III n=2 Tax=Granulicella pectinivorans TaxID=474950 RepID=A0A1I6MR12_9BACT|nr:Cytochrome C oxidase, cbb3-type, subunit III [Granulicella pectinivorans]
MGRYLVAAAITIMSASGTIAAHAQTGAETYKAKCMMCHAVDGSASTPAGKAMKAIPFSSPDLVKASDADLIAATTNGKGKMPAYTSKLTAPQIKDVVAYIRTLQK